ncbi:hypothetical protein [Saccharothrix hoggarensis]|uniref:Secreted protein n=1 Tax=Saccharothrix hoggarensis TaxID=913853 RepID=A0ABW3R6B8_9PSEU
MGFYTDGQGRKRPITPKKGGAAAAIVVGAVLAMGVAGGGAGGGLSPLGGGGSGGSAGQAVKARKAEGQRSAREGNAAEAWRRMGVRELKQVLRQDAACLAASHGRVQEFFLHTPCTSLDRVMLTVGDDAGNVAVVSVVWVGFRTGGDAREFQRLMDVHGSGDIRPLGAGVLGLADVVFSGHNYGSDRKNGGKVLTVAEAETAAGRHDPEFLDALAEVAAYLPTPPR